MTHLFALLLLPGLFLCYSLLLGGDFALASTFGLPARRWRCRRPHVLKLQAGLQRSKTSHQPIVISKRPTRTHGRSGNLSGYLHHRFRAHSTRRICPAHAAAAQHLPPALH